MRGVKLTTLIYAGMVAVAVTFFVTAMHFPPALSPGDIGPARFPQSIAIALVALIAVEWMVGRKAWPEMRRADVALAATVGACAAAAVELAGHIGFAAVVPPALFGGLWLLGERRVWLMIAYSAGFTLFLWLFFSYALGEPLASFGA